MHTACGTAFHNVADASIQLHLSAAHRDAMAGRLQADDTYTVRTYGCDLVLLDTLSASCPPRNPPGALPIPNPSGPPKVIQRG